LSEAIKQSSVEQHLFHILQKKKNTVVNYSSKLGDLLMGSILVATNSNLNVVHDMIILTSFWNVI